MKRIILGLFLAATAATAQAADFTQPAPVREAVFTWTGFYIGANGGYGTAKGAATLTGLTGPLAGFTSRSTGDGLTGPVAGGQGGFNVQTGMLVIGVEGDYQWANIGQTSTYGCGFGCSITEKTALNGFGTLRGRIGAAFDRVLVYGTAGGAWLNASDEATFTLGAITGQLGKVSLSGFGWTAGGGIEVAVDRNWSIKGEYLYLSTSKLTGNGAIALLGTVRLDVDAHAHIGRVGVNYRF